MFYRWKSVKKDYKSRKKIEILTLRGKEARRKESVMIHQIRAKSLAE